MNANKEKNMKYDIYRGSEKDMKESGGELMLEKCGKAQVREFCKRQGFDSSKFFDGDYMVSDTGGFWLEEAM
jgi:hypothetical protein